MASPEFETERARILAMDVSEDEKRRLLVRAAMAPAMSVVRAHFAFFGMGEEKPAPEPKKN